MNATYYDEDDNADDDEEEQDDHEIRITSKRCQEESLYMANVRRRTLRFSEEGPSIRTFEPAPYECHNDMYYSCHQLQKMMDAYYANDSYHDQQQEAETTTATIEEDSLSSSSSSSAEDWQI
jgi:hypothetical protein